jgi:O-antigen ligase
MFIAGSRLPSQWLGLQVGSAAQAVEQGNPWDRIIFSILILLAIGILMSRSFNWGGFFGRNLFLLAFISFGLVSVLWSDFPFVAFKRWFRDLGNYLVVFVVLSDPHPLEAARTLLRRLCYLLIPLSILLVKYYHYLAVQYDQWSGMAMFVGATTSKNMLGVACLISGVFFFWDTVVRWPDRRERRTKRIIKVNCAFMLMTLWLLSLSHSATSQVCLVIGCLVIAAANSGMGKRHPMFLKVLIPATFCLYLILAFGFELNGELATQLGRDPTLTDRTIIWQTVLSEHTNPLIGTGYESFWLGARLQRVWQVVPGINEAHNGYLDVYLNLGVIGVVLLAGFLISGYRTIGKKFASSYGLASLMFSMWSVTLFYNVTEAAFKGSLLWLVLLLGVIAVPARDVAIGEGLRAAKGLPKSPIRMKLQRG